MVTTTTLNDAAIKTLGGAPVQLIAGIPTKIIVPIIAIVELNSSGGIYSGISSSIYQLLINGYIFAASSPSTALEEPAGSYVNNIIANTVPGDANGIAGSPLMLSIPNGSDFTGGNASNSMRITVIYQVINAA